MKHETKVIPTGKGWAVVLWPDLPSIFSTDYEEQSVDIAPDGSQFLRTWASFGGESGEVRDELEKILANWPAGIVTSGKFEVTLGVTIKINGTELELNSQTLSSE